MKRDNDHRCSWEGAGPKAANRDGRKRVKVGAEAGKSSLLSRKGTMGSVEPQKIPF